MPDVRWVCTMVDGVPVVAAPAEIDITNTEQLRAVLLRATGRGRPPEPRPEEAGVVTER